MSFHLIVAKTSTYRQIQWNYNWIDLGIVTTSKLALKLLPDVKSELWHSVRGNFKNLNLNVLNYRFECVFRMWEVSFTSQVFPSSYKQLSISDHQNSPNIFNNSEYILSIQWMPVIRTSLGIAYSILKSRKNVPNMEVFLNRGKLLRTWIIGEKIRT